MMKRPGSLLQQLLFVTGGAFIAAALVLIVLGNRALREVVDQGQEHIYRDKLATISRTLGVHHSRLAATGRVEAYEKGFQRAALESLRSSYYGEGRGPAYPVILDIKGNILLHPALVDGEQLPADKEYIERVVSTGQGAFNYSYQQKEKKWCIFETFEPWGWILVFTVPEKFKYRQVAHFNTSVMWTLLLIGVLVLSLLSLFVYRVVKPLSHLSRASRAIAGGDLHIELHSERKDEIGELVRNFSAMQHAVKTQVLELEQKNSALHDEIEQRRKASAALVESEQRYREIFNTPMDAIVLHDAITGKIIDVNQGMLDMFGCTHEQALSLQMEGLIPNVPPYTMEEFDHHLRKALEEGPHTFEWRSRKTSGEIFWTEVSFKQVEFGGTRYILAVARDINSRKIAVQALEEEQERLAVTLRSIGDGVVATDEKGKTVLLNRVGETLLGIRADKACGRFFNELFVLEEPNQSRGIVDHLLSGGSVHVDTAMYIQDDHGTRRDVSLNGNPIFSRAGKVIGSVIVVRDITETLKMETEILKGKKLESIGMLAGGIAHDFNNLIFAIQGNVNLAMSMPDIGEKMQRYLTAADSAGIRAAELTQQLLTFAKGGDPCKRPASLHPLLEQAATAVLESTETTLEYGCDPDIGQVNMDTNQIYQVVQNIVRNGMQAMDGKGEITIICENHIHGEGESGFLPPGRYVHVSVADTGKGISSEHLDKIFDPYYTIDPEGQGLGLAICHSVIRNHDGYLTVESEQGQGSVFHFYLPAIQEKAEPIESCQPVSADRAGTRCVMVMDDEAMIRNLVAELLVEEGYNVVTAKDGEEAVALYREMLEQSAPPDVVLMDLTIPGGMGGKDAARIIKQLDPSARLIVSSGYSTDPVLAHYQDYGFCNALMKPYRREDLFSSITKAFGVQ